MKLSNRGLISWITVAIISLIVSYVIMFADQVAENTWYVLIVIAVSVFLLFSNFQARKFKNDPIKYFLWVYLPLIILTAIPVYFYLTGESGVNTEDWIFLARIGTGLIIPLFILYFVRNQLTKKHQE